MQGIEVYQNLTSNRPLKGRFLNLTNSSMPNPWTRNGGQAPIPRSRQTNVFKSINSEQGTSPCSSGHDVAIIVRSIVLAFRFAQGVQSSLTLGRNIMVKKLKWRCLFNYYLRNRPARVGSSLQYMLANSIHPGLPHTPPFGRRGVGLGELARLKRGYGKVAWFKSYQMLTETLYRSVMGNKF